MFEVPASKASVDQDKFPFKAGGKTFKIKRAKYLSLREQLAIANTESLEDRITKIFGPAADAVLDLDDEQFEALMDAYNADSDVTPGESDGPANS